MQNYLYMYQKTVGLSIQNKGKTVFPSLCTDQPVQLRQKVLSAGGLIIELWHDMSNTTHTNFTERHAHAYITAVKITLFLQ